MSTRAAAAADLRSRIAGNLTASANGEGPEPPASVVAGVSALPKTPESGVGTFSQSTAPDGTPAGEPDAEISVAVQAPEAPALAPPAEPVAAAAERAPAAADVPAPLPVATPAAVPIGVPSPPIPVPAAPAAVATAPVPVAAKGWDKLSITLSRADFGILETQTGQARAAGIKMRRGGNPSVFLRAALRNLESLRLTNNAAWLELVRGVALTENS